MTTRYLMRLGKTPFDVVDAFHTLDQNLLGTNSGNLVYGASSHKLFSTRDTVVDGELLPHQREDGRRRER